MKQLFITDLDGTFLTPQGVVSDESARIISQLSSRGVPITVATARTPATVEPLLSHTLTNLPAIVLTGAALWDRKSHQYLNTHFFPHRLAVSAWRCCLDHGIRPFIYMLGNDTFLAGRIPNESHMWLSHPHGAGVHQCPHRKPLQANSCH